MAQHWPHVAFKNFVAFGFDDAMWGVMHDHFLEIFRSTTVNQSKSYVCLVLGVHHCTDCQDDQVQEEPSGSGLPKVAGVMDENTFKPFLTSAATAGWLQIFLARGSSIEILRPHSCPF